MLLTKKFNEFFERFKQSPQWESMTATVENSPYHREENVALHTEMTIDHYRAHFSSNRTNKESVISLLALLFHDVGKPAAEEVLEKKDGSGEIYRRYAGHEQDSAVAFMQFYVSSSELRDLIGPHDARVVRWIIEHHLPYSLKNVRKRQDLAVATIQTLRACSLRYDVFFDCLRSDAAGRISDDHETKLQNVEAWIAEFKAIADPDKISDGYPSLVNWMHLLVGPSGSGKTTFIKQHKQINDIVISMDEYRLMFLDMQNINETYISEAEKYSRAWHFANDNEAMFKKFTEQKVKEVYQQVISGKVQDVYVDMTNGSKKSRAHWVDFARKAGLNIQAVEFWNTRETLIARQQTRSDKAVPATAIDQQLMASSCCWLGSEVQEVYVVIGA